MFPKPGDVLKTSGAFPACNCVTSTCGNVFGGMNSGVTWMSGFCFSKLLMSALQTSSPPVFVAKRIASDAQPAGAQIDLRVLRVR